jgi:tripartite motif-containing protein 71
MRQGLLLAAGVALAAILPGVSTSQAVSRQDPGVTLETTWGAFGQSPGQFHQPRGIAIAPDGNVVVLDYANYRIQVFSAGGALVDVWGHFGPGDFGFYRPSDLAVDRTGRIAISQWADDKVNVFSEDGSFLFVMMGPENPASVAVDQDGFFYIGEGHRTSDIVKLDPEGSPITRFGQGIFGDDSPGGITVTPEGNVIASDTGHDRILVFDAAGTLLLQWGSSGNGPGQFDEPRGVAVDAGGDVYVADTANQRVQVFDPAGRFLLQWGGFGLDLGEFRYPWDLAVDAAGSVYVTDCFNHRVQKFRVTLPASGGMLTAVEPTTWGKLKTMFAR